MKKTIIIALTLILVLASFTSCENNIHEHTWDKGTVTKEATCTEAGVITYTCTGCKETETKALEALGHSWDEGVITKSTYLTKGTKTFTCQREGCGETETEEIPSIPISGKVFAYYQGKDKDDKDLIGLFVMGDQQVTMYGGVVNADSVTATNGFSAPYNINVKDKTFTVTPPGGTPVTFGLEEYLDENGNVVILKGTMDSIVYYLNPITGLETVEKGNEAGHYIKVYNTNPISIKVLNNNNEISEAISLKSISYAVEHEIETKPGYLTKGAYNCSVCGYKGDIPVISLTNTKWTSTSVIETNNPVLNDINGKKLIIEFNDYPTATISAKADSDSEPFLINSIISYDLELNENPKTISLIGGNDIQYTGSINEDINDETITITNFTMYLSSDKSVEIGTITFKQNKQ